MELCAGDDNKWTVIMDARRHVRSSIRCFWGRHNLTIMVLCLLSASLYYTIGVQRMLERIHSSNPDAFATGDIVTIVGVIDGDELLIENQEGVPTRLRILGIKSFSPTLSDPLLSEYGKICFDYLQARVTHQPVRLEISEKVLDTEGRLLGTLFLKNPQGEYTIDLARDLVDKGYTLVYTRFRFGKMADYLTVQQGARANYNGFWSNDIVSARSLALLKLWEEEGAGG